MLWRKIIGYWKSIVVLSAIGYVSLMRESSIAMPHIAGMDKWIHSSMYLLLTIILLWDSRRLTPPQSWLIVAIFSAIYGGFIEVLQEYFFYPRTGDWMDWLADCVGVIIGLGLWIIGVKWYEQRMAK